MFLFYFMGFDIWAQGANSLWRRKLWVKRDSFFAVVLVAFVQRRFPFGLPKAYQYPVGQHQ